MHVDAIDDQGTLEFITPVTLKHNTLRVIVEIPDDAIEFGDSPDDLPKQILQPACAMRDKRDAIRDAPPPPDDALPDLTDKQRQRLDAFALREDR